MSANFVGNTPAQSEAIETYTPYDVTSSRPRKTKISRWLQESEGCLSGAIMYILPSKQEGEILFDATRTCVWLKLDVCSMCVTEVRDRKG